MNLLFNVHYLETTDWPCTIIRVKNTWSKSIKLCVNNITTVVCYFKNTVNMDNYVHHGKLHCS